MPSCAAPPHRRPWRAQDGQLRANMVAAGVLPAVRAALSSKKLSRSIQVVAALCSLCRVLVGPRALAGSRAALCAAFADTGAVAAALGALARHASHEGVASACCALLAAFHDVFDTGEPMPVLFRLALADPATRDALKQVKELHAHDPTIGFATKWALKVGKAAAAGGTAPAATAGDRFGQSHREVLTRAKENGSSENIVRDLRAGKETVCRHRVL